MKKKAKFPKEKKKSCLCFDTSLIQSFNIKFKVRALKNSHIFFVLLLRIYFQLSWVEKVLNCPQRRYPLRPFKWVSCRVACARLSDKRRDVGEISRVWSGIGSGCEKRRVPLSSVPRAFFASVICVIISEPGTGYFQRNRNLVAWDDISSWKCSWTC